MYIRNIRSLAHVHTHHTSPRKHPQQAGSDTVHAVCLFGRGASDCTSSTPIIGLHILEKKPLTAGQLYSPYYCFDGTLRPLSAVPSIFRLLASFREENLSGDSDSHVGLRVEPMLCFPGTRRSSGFHLFSCHASRRAGRNAFLDQPCGPSAPLVWHGLCHAVLSTATLFTATLRSSQKLAGES